MEEPIEESPPSNPVTPTTSMRTPKNSRKPVIKRGFSKQGNVPNNITDQTTNKKSSIQSSMQIQKKSSEIGPDIKKQKDDSQQFTNAAVNKSNGTTSKNSIPQRRGMFNKDNTSKIGGNAGAKPKPKV